MTCGRRCSSDVRDRKNYPRDCEKHHGDNFYGMPCRKFQVVYKNYWYWKRSRLALFRLGMSGY